MEYNSSFCMYTLVVHSNLCMFIFNSSLLYTVVLAQYVSIIVDNFNEYFRQTFSRCNSLWSKIITEVNFMWCLVFCMLPDKNEIWDFQNLSPIRAFLKNGNKMMPIISLSGLTYVRQVSSLDKNWGMHFYRILLIISEIKYRIKIKNYRFLSKMTLFIFKLFSIRSLSSHSSAFLVKFPK